MKLTYNQETDHKQIRRLTHMLLQSRKGEIMSGMKARHFFSETYGLGIDHHEYAYTLDEMSRNDEAEYYSHNWGDTEYLIK